MLRIIAGTAKGRRLKSVPREGTRPALAQVRAATFNIAQAFVAGARFLDLFAGTGAYSIEAMSRGADTATLVELDRKATVVIKQNLRLCGFSEQSIVINGDVLRVVERLKRNGSVFDIIMVAPPYFHGLGPATMLKICDSGILAPDGLCFVQHHVKERVDERFGDLALAKRYAYGSNMLSLYRHDLPAPATVGEKADGLQ